MFILAVLEFLHIKSKLLIYKRIIEYLDESERIKYQKAIAIPTAIIGIIWLISGVFFWNQEYIFKIGLYGGWCIWFVWMLVVNKKHLGYLFPLNVPKKIF
jgi:hypothetical protein